MPWQDMDDQELLRKRGRYHTPLANIEFDCWVWQDAIPEPLPHDIDDENAYMYRFTFDPYTLERV